MRRTEEFWRKGRLAEADGEVLAEPPQTADCLSGIYRERKELVK